MSITVPLVYANLKNPIIQIMFTIPFSHICTDPLYVRYALVAKGEL